MPVPPTTYDDHCNANWHAGWWWAILCDHLVIMLPTIVRLSKISISGHLIGFRLKLNRRNVKISYDFTTDDRSWRIIRQTTSLRPKIFRLCISWLVWSKWKSENTHAFPDGARGCWQQTETCQQFWISRKNWVQITWIVFRHVCFKVRIRRL